MIGSSRLVQHPFWTLKHWMGAPHVLAQKLCLNVIAYLGAQETSWSESVGSQNLASTGKRIASIMNRPYRYQMLDSVMIEAQLWTVKCQDCADGSDDVFVDLPADLLVDMGLSSGDVLIIEVIDGAIVLTPKAKNLMTL